MIEEARDHETELKARREYRKKLDRFLKADKPHGEPPLLSDNPYLKNKSCWSIFGSYIIPADVYEAGKKAQRDSDIKWMRGE